jgi:hypothetical protein
MFSILCAPICIMFNFFKSIQFKLNWIWFKNVFLFNLSCIKCQLIFSFKRNENIFYKINLMFSSFIVIYNAQQHKAQII